MAFRIEWSPEARDHLKLLSTADMRRAVDGAERGLSDQPTSRTRNRKELRKNPLASWELRLGDLRVYYDVRDDAVVIVQAVGRKQRNELWIGSERVEL